jgi:hypothetical protein
MLSDQITEDEKGGHVEGKILVGKLEGRRQLGRPRRIWMILKMYLYKTGF